MSECVVRMEMPKGCVDCRVRDMFLCCSLKEGKYTGSSPVRPNWCPIVRQLPEGHGRLIDASTIIGEVDAGYTDDYGIPIPVSRPVSVDEYLGLEVSTIVPAERSKA